MSCFTIATMKGDTLASGDYAFAYMATNALPPIIGMMFMICGLSATMSSGDSDAISGVTILLTVVYPSVTCKTIPAAEIMAMGFDETDPHDQYVIVKDRDGAESTFRNSYVDIFIS